MKKILSVVLVVIMMLSVVGCREKGKYIKAIELIDSGDYAKSYELFSDIDGYRDSADYLSRFIVCYDKVVQTYSGGIYSTTEYTYDTFGNITKEVEEDSYGTYTNEYSYDSKGNITLSVYTGFGIISTDEYAYDSNGNITQRVHTNSDGIISTYEYAYYGEHIFYNP